MPAESTPCTAWGACFTACMVGSEADGCRPLNNRHIVRDALSGNSFLALFALGWKPKTICRVYHNDRVISLQLANYQVICKRVSGCRSGHKSYEDSEAMVIRALCFDITSDVAPMEEITVIL